MSRLALDVSLERGDFRLAVDAALDLTGITALFGPSGSGKTTLLRIVAGLERRARGSVRLDEAVWQDATRFVPPHRRRVGYVFQDARLFAHLDVAGNLAFGARRGGARGAIRRDDVVEALALAPLLGRRPASLSGGEAQRVAIGRALLGDPRLLVMDEPVNALDVARKREILAYVERIPPLFGLPIVYVTHSVDEVARLADTVVLMRDGTLAGRGGVAEVLGDVEHWALTGRADAGAVLEARLVAHAAGMSTVAVGTQQLKLPRIDAEPGATLRLRVKARDVAIATEHPRHLSIRNVLAMRVERIDLDETVYAELLLASDDCRLRARITRDALEELALAEGREVYALIKSVSFDTGLLAG